MSTKENDVLYEYVAHNLDRCESSGEVDDFENKMSICGKLDDVISQACDDRRLEISWEEMTPRQREIETEMSVRETTYER